MDAAFANRKPRLTFIAGGVQVAEVEANPPPGQAIRCALQPKLLKILRRKQKDGHLPFVVLETRESRHQTEISALAHWLHTNLPGEVLKDETAIETAIRVLRTWKDRMDEGEEPECFLPETEGKSTDVPVETEA